MMGISGTGVVPVHFVQPAQTYPVGTTYLGPWTSPLVSRFSFSVDYSPWTLPATVSVTPESTIDGVTWFAVSGGSVQAVPPPWPRVKGGPTSTGTMSGTCDPPVQGLYIRLSVTVTGADVPLGAIMADLL